MEKRNFRERNRLDFYKQRTIEFVPKTNSVRLIDQTSLPTKLNFINCRTVDELIFAIKNMQIRGAPAIGVAGAMGVALSFWRHRNKANLNTILDKVRSDASEIKKARPTAVNLVWGVDQALLFLKTTLSAHETDPPAVYQSLVEFVNELADKDVAANKALSTAGAVLIPNHANVLTHCK